MILGESIESGTITTVKEMAEMLDLGKTPVREAILKLGEEGYVQIIPRKGVLIKSLKAKDIVNHFQLREAIEVFAIDGFIDAYNDSINDRLIAIIDAQVQKVKNNDITGFIKLDESFHSIIVESIDNELANITIKNIRRKLFYLGVSNLTGHKDTDEAIQEHRRLLKALQNGNHALAKDILHKHITDACTNVLSRYLV